MKTRFQVKLNSDSSFECVVSCNEIQFTIREKQGYLEISKEVFCNLKRMIYNNTAIDTTYPYSEK